MRKETAVETGLLMGRVVVSWNRFTLVPFLSFRHVVLNLGFPGGHPAVSDWRHGMSRKLNGGAVCTPRAHVRLTRRPMFFLLDPLSKETLRAYTRLTWYVLHAADRFPRLDVVIYRWVVGVHMWRRFRVHAKVYSWVCLSCSPQTYSLSSHPAGTSNTRQGGTSSGRGWRWDTSRQCTALRRWTRST